MKKFYLEAWSPIQHSLWLWDEVLELGTGWTPENPDTSQVSAPCWEAISDVWQIGGCMCALAGGHWAGWGLYTHGTPISGSWRPCGPYCCQQAGAPGKCCRHISALKELKFWHPGKEKGEEDEDEGEDDDDEVGSSTVFFLVYKAFNPPVHNSLLLKKKN